MGIEVYLIPPGNREFRKALIGKAVKGVGGPDFSNILYLAPTRHMVRNWAREFHPAGGACYIPPRTATLKGLSRSLYAMHGGGTLLEKGIVPLAIAGLAGRGMGYATIAADFISEMKNRFPSEGADSIKQTLADAFAELAVPEEVARRVFDAMEVFSVYNEALRAAGADDEDDALVHAALVAGRALKPEVLVLDGFYEVTPAEARFIEALVDRAGKTLISIPISHSGDDLTHCYSHFIEERFGVKPVFLPSPDGEPEMCYEAARSKEEELEGIARHIKSSFVSGRLRELDRVYVAFPKLSDYREMFYRVFNRYGIPCSSPPPVLRPYRDLLSLIEAVRDGFPRLATARFLTSPYFKGIPEDLRRAAPGIALDAGAVRDKDSWLRALKNSGVKKEETELFKRVSEIDCRASTYTAFIDNLAGMLKGLSFDPGEEEPGTFERTLKSLGVLDSIPGIRPVDLHGFAEALSSYLSYGIAEDKEEAGVHVADLRELRGIEPEHLYLGGLKDGDLPARPEMDFLLPDSVRARLGLVDMHRYLRLQGYIFRRLVSTAGRLRLSYPAMEGDKLFLPSLYLRSGTETAPERLFGDFSPEEALTRKTGEPLSSRIRETTGIKRYGGNSPIRVTDIDAYRSCPRKFFIEKVLGIEPPEIREYEVDPKTMGIIVHEVMEKLIGPPLEGMDAFRRRAERIIDAVLEERPIEDYFKALIKESLLTALPEIYELEEGLASEGYSPSRAEYAIDGEPLPGIRLKGKIDRVDVKDGGEALVLDYKTGGAELSSTRTLKEGATLQPFIYAAMLKAEGKESPESVGIYSLKDLRIKRVPDRNDRREGRALDLFIDTALLYLDSAVSAMRDGDFKARPLSDSNCRRCHERPYCPYIQGDAK